MDYKEIGVTPQSTALGAVISGIDLSKEPSKRAMAELEDAFGRYSVIFFRDQNLTPQQHIAMAERWGAINVNRFFKPLDGYPQIAQVIKEANQKENIGGTWHTDHSYDLIPAMGSMLYAREVPTVGGDTLFSSMYLAYEALSEDMKKMLADLKAWHSSRHAFGYSVTDSEHFEDGRLANPGQATQDALHPVVITHPLTGRKALYVNADFTVRFDGWTVEESQPILDLLYAHGARQEFTCRFHWEPDSIAFWDNRATWHYAMNDYQGHRRIMHRITLEGVALN
ncbi:MAG: TauD/TfdA family dioxygenase [Acidiferrobacteraceae bacterium]|nr:TauD/TfdA family dioxygenase [Acidiferrobacteraceae bacterium]